MQDTTTVTPPEMRDIRDDLLERARFLEREMTIAEEDYYRAVALAQTALRAKLAALSTRLLADNYRAFLADFLESDQIR